MLSTDKVLEFLRRRGPAFLLGLGVVFLLWLPMLLMSVHRNFQKRHFPDFFNSWPNNGSFNYLGYCDSIGGSVDDHLYAARAREAARRWLPCDPYVPENRTWNLMTTDVISFMAPGLVFRFVKDIQRTWLISRCIFGFLWFYLLYLILLEALPNADSSAAPYFGAAFLTIFSDIFFVTPDKSLVEMAKETARVLFWLMGNDAATLGPTRIISRAFTMVPFWLACVLAVRNALGKSRALAVACGVVGGLTMYVHLDVGSTYMAATFLFAAVVSWRRRRPVWELWLSAAVSLAVSIPWFLAHFPADWDSLNRIPVFFSHAPSKYSLLYLAAGLYCLRGEPDVTRLWGASVLGAVFVALNTQVVMGYYIFPVYWMYIGSFYCAILALQGLSGRLKSPSFWRCALAVSLCVAAGRATAYAALHYRFYALTRGQEEALSWLNANTRPGSVVATLAPSANAFLGSLTEDKPLAANLHPLVSDLPAAENARRLVYAAGLYGLTGERYVKEAYDCGFLAYAVKRYGELQWQHQNDPLLAESMNMLGSFFVGYSCKTARGFLARAAKEAPKDYRVDYVWYGPFEKKLTGGKFSPRLPATLAYGNADVSLYKLGR